MNNKKLIVFGVMILLVITIVSISAIKYTNTKTTKCIVDRTQLFMQPGSSDFEVQLNLLGKDKDKFNIVNCFSEHKKCSGVDISNTPMWKINNKEIYKVLGIGKLKELTNC